MFDETQIKALEAKLDPKHVTQRTQSGRTLDYIEGWQAIAEANRIFGFGAWDRQTITMQEIRRDIVKDRYNKDQWRVGYMAQVRVVVHIDNEKVMREGTGFGSGAMGDLGEAIESAIKEAETDAMKRALMTFGNPFGLALYDKTRSHVGIDEPEKTPSKNDNARKLFETLVTDLRRCDTPNECDSWWTDADCKEHRAKLPNDWVEHLKSEFKTHKIAVFEKSKNAEKTPFEGG